MEGLRSSARRRGATGIPVVAGDSGGAPMPSSWQDWIVVQGRLRSRRLHSNVATQILTDPELAEPDGDRGWGVDRNRRGGTEDRSIG